MHAGVWETMFYLISLCLLCRRGGEGRDARARSRFTMCLCHVSRAMHVPTRAECVSSSSLILMVLSHLRPSTHLRLRPAYYTAYTYTFTPYNHIHIAF